MQSNIGLNVKSNYHIDLIDSITGNIKQSGDFHNTPIQGFSSLLTGYSSDTSEQQYGYNTLRMSNIMNSLTVGSGTAQPSNTDKGLASPLWTVGAGSVSREWIDKYTVRATGTYTFPAASSYVGTVTEVGLVNYGYGTYTHSEVCTHALLTDSEGQQISFNKTDLDILIINVTVELSLVSSDPTFKILPYSAVLWYASGLGTTQGDNWANKQFGYLNACRFDFDMLNTDGSVSLDTSISTNAQFYGKANGPSDTYIRYSKSRLAATDVTSERYYKYIAVPGIGYWDLTDSSVFPPYEIKNITIGTGDGSKTEFTNPLSYFKADTDKVYKNGVQLTRGVDYTISSASNAMCLPEVTQDTIGAPMAHSDINRTAYSNNMYAKPLLIPSVNSAFTVRNMPSNYAFAFNANNPLYVEYSEPATLNCMKSTGLCYASTNINYPQTLPAGVTFYIDYSIDGVNYTEAGSVTTSASEGAFMLDFEEHTAKYWRIRTSFSGPNGAAVMTGSKVNDMRNQMLTLNRKIPNIVFTEAPSDGDLLTMDVTMDRAMKNDKFVIDVECKINFSY